jgi:hypothetical protein
MKRLLVPFLLATLPASASVIITFAEDPYSYQSTLSGTAVYDFNSSPTGTGRNVVWDGVGTFDQLEIKKADAYGGAADANFPNGSNYSVQGAGSRVLTSTLVLKTDSAYFGMWWSAGDARNVLSFFDGDNLVSRFTTSSLMEPLPASYDGNPINRKVNSGEPYAFINFFGDEKTTWDRIVFSNDGSSGFESDNYTSRVAAWDPAVDGALSGIVVAEVTGTTTTRLTKEDLVNTRWSLDETTVTKVPGAPVPPWLLLAAFGAAAIFRNSRKTSAA